MYSLVFQPLPLRFHPIKFLYLLILIYGGGQHYVEIMRLKLSKNVCMREYVNVHRRR